MLDSCRGRLSLASTAWTREVLVRPGCATRAVYRYDVPEDDWGNLARLSLLVHVYSYMCNVCGGQSPPCMCTLAQVEAEGADFVALALCVAFG